VAFSFVGFTALERLISTAEAATDPRLTQGEFNGQSVDNSTVSVGKIMDSHGAALWTHGHPMRWLSREGEEVEAAASPPG